MVENGRAGGPLGCDEVRAQLADFMLGTLTDMEMAAVRRHLRGCGACRAEAAGLDQGIALFATAAHVTEPPAELKNQVMSALAEEWSETPRTVRASWFPPSRWLALAAAVVALAGALSWAGYAQIQSNRTRADAASYRNFLGALGGRGVRVAVLKPASDVAIDGSAILYDSDRERSWALVLARIPGYSGTISVTLSSPDGRSIQMRPLQVEAEGDGSTWLVTSSDISSFTRVTLRSATGTVLAAGVAIAED